MASSVGMNAHLDPSHKESGIRGCPIVHLGAIPVTNPAPTSSGYMHGIGNAIHMLPQYLDFNIISLVLAENDKDKR